LRVRKNRALRGRTGNRRVKTTAQLGASQFVFLARVAYKIVVGKPEGKRTLGKPKRRWEDSCCHRDGPSRIA
jgi:hypothetical protein